LSEDNTCYKCDYDEAEEYFRCNKCGHLFCEECYWGDDLCHMCAFHTCRQCNGIFSVNEENITTCEGCGYGYCDDCMSDLGYCLSCVINTIQQNVGSYLIHRRTSGFDTNRTYVIERRTMFEFLCQRHKYTILWEATTDNDFMYKEYREFRKLQAEDKTALVGAISWV
jgi:hypothetical protein